MTATRNDQHKLNSIVAQTEPSAHDSTQRMPTGLADMTRFAAFEALLARSEALPVFQEISQPFFVPGLDG